MHIILLFLFFTSSESVGLKYTNTYTPEEFLNSHQHTHTHLYNNITENLHTHSHIHRYINGTLVRSHAHLYNSIYSLITFEPTSYKHTHIHTHLYKNISNNTHEHNHSHTYTPDGKLLKDHVHSFGESIIFSPLVTKSYNNIIGFNTTDKSNNSSHNGFIKTINKLIIFIPILYYYYQNH